MKTSLKEESGLPLSRNCDYTVSYGLIEMLNALTGKEKQEIWSILADNTQICFDRLKKKKHQTESWKWFDFPDTEIRMKVKVEVYKSWDNGEYNIKGKARANITFDPDCVEEFTSRDVEEFLVEKVLLGVED